MRNLLMVILAVFMSWMHNAHAQPLTVDPESIVPLPDKFDMETPAPDVPPEIARFQGAWIGTWHDDRHILVVERVTPDGHANVVFAQSDSALYGMNREWWRDKATIVDGVLTMNGFRIFRYAFDGPDRLYLTATIASGVASGNITSGYWSALTWHALPLAIDRQTGHGPASACGFRTSQFGRPMAHGRSCLRRRSTRRPAMARHRLRSSPTGPTSVGTS